MKNGWRDGQDVKRRKRKGRERNDAERKKQIVPVQAQHRTLTAPLAHALLPVSSLCWGGSAACVVGVCAWVVPEEESCRPGVKIAGLAVGALFIIAFPSFFPWAQN